MADPAVPGADGVRNVRGTTKHKGDTSVTHAHVFDGHGKHVGSLSGVEKNGKMTLSTSPTYGPQGKPRPGRPVVTTGNCPG